MEYVADLLKAIASDYLQGRLSPLETAAALAPFEEAAPAELRHHLTAMIGVASETDDIPLGPLRQLWHPDVRQGEDDKHDRAQAWAEPIVRATCEALVRT